jgi:hypothetical protein
MKVYKCNKKPESGSKFVNNSESAAGFQCYRDVTSLEIQDDTFKHFLVLSMEPRTSNILGEHTSLSCTSASPRKAPLTCEC